MKDGYYLATYLPPVGVPNLVNLVNVTLRHDSNLSLWEKTGSTVRLVCHWELERITGQKHHETSFLKLGDMNHFINGLLASFDLKLDDLVEVWGTPDLSTSNDYHLIEQFPDISYHSLAHLYSAILLDSDIFFDRTILGLAVDGGPDRVLEPRLKENWFAGCVVRRGELEVFPVDSPGPLYLIARYRFSRQEGTLMALATATKAIGHCNRDQLLDEFGFSGTTVRAMRKAFDKMWKAFDLLLAQVRQTARTDPEFTADESFISAVMKEVQAISVMMMERNVERIIDRYSVDPAEAYLALSGGFALNCPTNSHLMRKYGFVGLLAPPCVSDCGQSIGIALAAFHKKAEGRRFDFAFPGAYLGRADADLDGALGDYREFVAGVADFDHDVAIADILQGPVVWFNGRSEIGPRALGNRSLLANPTSHAAKAALNGIKQREWWRPVAPVVLEEHLAEWFEDSRPSPYMLETFQIRSDKRDRIPAIAHLDYSARVQSLSRPQNPALYELLVAFYQRTGIPMLCNTSLNDKGEPIIDKISEMINFCLRKKISVGYGNGRRVLFRNADCYPVDHPLPRSQELFSQIVTA